MSNIEVELPNPAEWRPGAVSFTEWNRVPWLQRLAMGVVGDVIVVSSNQALGFEMSGGGHANWLAVVRGPTGALHVIPGCKIQSITYGSPPANEEFVAVP